MKLCFPVQANEGFASEVYGHFGSAPMFLVVDMEASNISVINNRDLHHVHGACNPTKALDGQNVDAIIVEGIGGGALMKLNQAGLLVYKAMGLTVKDNLDLLNSGKLPVFQPGHACAGHSDSGGCRH